MVTINITVGYACETTVSNELTNVRLMYAEHRACLEHACDLITNL